MKEDKELQKKLRSAFESPDVPFEEWAQKRGIISSSEGERVQCSVTVVADNVNGSSAFYANKKKALIIGASVVTLFIVVAIILFSVLPRINAPKVYGANDTQIVNISFEEVTQNKDVYLFAIDVNSKPELVTKDVLIEDNSRVMTYTLYRSLISVKNGESYDGFYITYRIRTYSYYEFVGYSKYENLSNRLNVSNFTVEYAIDETSDVVGYARFAVGNYEYFIEASGYPGVTVVNEANFENLLSKILI